MKKKELFAYIERLDYLLADAVKRIRKLEDENVNTRVLLSRVNHELENFRPKHPLVKEAPKTYPFGMEVTCSVTQEMVVPDIQEAMRRERMKQVITADSFDSFLNTEAINDR